MNFLWIVGPPAVGKMAVGLEIVKKTGYKLLHNHGTIEIIIPIFDYGTPKFHLLNNEFRKRIFEEVATSDLLGFIFTYVSAFNLEEEKEYMEKVTKIFENQGHIVYYVELYAPLEIRLERNKHPLRLDAKASKRDIKWSDESLIKMEKKYPHLNSSDEYPFFFPKNYVKIDNSNLSPEEAADRVIQKFNLVKNL
jgi:hypothetical protein